MLFENLIAGLQYEFGIEPRDRREFVEPRQKLIRELVTVNYWKPEFRTAHHQEIIKIQEQLDALGKELSALDIPIQAEERIRVRGLCLARCALPAAYARRSALTELGIEVEPEVHPKYRLPQTEEADRFRMQCGSLLLVNFPDGWTLEPNFSEPGITNKILPNAVVRDETGASRIDVCYRNATLGNYAIGWTQILRTSTTG